jgi:dTDP-4-dehydrorhamnose reductase
MRILVTGANGLVGSRTCHLLVEQGHEVVGLGRGERRATGSWRYVPCELTREQEVSAAFADASPEVVIHCGSMTEVDACEREPELAFAANVDATAYVARASCRAGAHLVHVSTDYVFDGEAGPYDEEALPNPRGVYSVTKHMGEQAARVLAPGCTVARTAVVYGWPPVAGRLNFGAWLLTTLEKGQPVRLFDDQFVSPSYAENVAAMVAELGVRGLGGIWHTCGAEVLSRVHFGRAFCEVFGFDAGLIVPVKLAELKLPAPRPLRSGLRTDKARHGLKARPLGLAESLTRFHADWRRTRG